MPSGTVTPGGSSLPSQWSTAAASGALTINTPVGQSGYIKLLYNNGAGFNAATSDNGAGTTSSLSLTGTNQQPTVLSVEDGAASGNGVFLNGTGELALFTATALRAVECWDATGSALRFAIMPTGQPMICVTSAPADGDLIASQLALWFDDTNGAAKLKVKAKTADGTVVTGTVNLA